MTKKQTESLTPHKTLRSRADIANMSPEEIQKLVHELQVHQIELQLQNEELLATQTELSQSRDRYSDLYEFAPVGYLTIDMSGVIRESNLTAASILAVDRRTLVDHKFSDFVARDSQDILHLHRQNVLLRDDKATCELTLLRPDNVACVVRLECLAVSEAGGGDQDTDSIRCAMTDITQEIEAKEWEIQAKRLRILVENLPAGAVFIEHDRIEINRATELITGYSREELTTKDQWFTNLYGDQANEIRRFYYTDRRAGFPSPATCTLTRKDGETRIIEFICHVFDDHDVWLLNDVTQRQQLEAERKRRIRVLDALASGASLPTVLELIVQLAEEAVPEMLGSILLLNEKNQELNAGATGRLPTAYSQAIDGLAIGANIGSCGAAAATGKRVIVEDIARHQNWAQFRELASVNRLGACWSEPIFALSGQVLGTLGFYFSKPRSPSDTELELLPQLAQLASIAIERAGGVEKIRTSEQRLQLALRASNDAVWDWDVATDVVWRNESYSKLYGTQDEPCSLQWWVNRIHPADRVRVTHSLKSFAQQNCGSEFWTDEYRYLRTDGQYASIIDRAYRSTDEHGNTLRVIGSMTDMTERRALEKEVLDIAASESRRIGSDLHDGVGQELTGLSLVIEALAASTKSETRDDSTVSKLVDTLEAGIKRSLDQVRALARGMNPVDVDAEGLMSALDELSLRLAGLYNIECQFECECPILFRDTQTATQLYRIAQEATTNAIKHGRAKSIIISLESENGRSLLRITDNGIGISDAPNQRTGMGLRIMGYRAGIIGCQLTIGRVDSGGTEVRCLLTKENE